MLKHNITTENFVKMKRIRKTKLQRIRKDLIRMYKIREIPSKAMEKVLQEMGFLKKKK